jgi:hypothetical protein
VPLPAKAAGPASVRHSPEIRDLYSNVMVRAS